MSEINLNQIQITLLETISEQEKPTTKSLYEKEAFNQNYSDKQGFRVFLHRIENDKSLIEVAGKDGRSNIYQLSAKGSNALSKIRDRENNDLEEQEFYDRNNAKEVFRSYFENKAKHQITRAKQGKDVIVDLKSLAEFDVDLEEDLRGNFEETIEACESALAGYPDIDSKPTVRLENPFDSDLIEISDIDAKEDFNNIAVVNGVIETVSSPKGQLTKGIFQCVECGDRYSKEQTDGKLKSPYKCDCGSKKFDTLDKVFQTVFVGRLKDKPSKKNRKAIQFIVKGELTDSNLLEYSGSTVKAIGQVKMIKKNKNSDFHEPLLEINNIEFDEQRWDDIEVEEEDEKVINEFRESKDDFNDLVDSLALSVAKDEIAKLELFKEAILVFLLGKNPDSSESNLHLLAIGEPGTGKSHLANYVRDNFPKVIKSLGTGSTGVGLTATAKKDELTNEWVAEAGAIPQADKGFHITDEIDKADSSDLVKMNEALSDNTISITKGSVNTTISADVSELALGNPENKTLDPYKELTKQIPIKEDDLLSRFDIKLLIYDDDSKQDKQEKLDRVLGKKLDSKVEDELIEEEYLRKYIFTAQQLNPEIPVEIEDKLKDIFFNLKDLESDQEDKTLINIRRFETLMKLSKAYARLDLSDKVEEKHLERANWFFRKTLETMGIITGRDSIEVESNSENKNKKEEIRKIIPEDGIEIDKVINKAQKLDIEPEETKEYLEQLKSDGELFQPSEDKINQL